MDIIEPKCTISSQSDIIAYGDIIALRTPKSKHVRKGETLFRVHDGCFFRERAISFIFYNCF